LLRTIQANLIDDDAAQQLNLVAGSRQADQLVISFVQDLLAKRRHQGVDSDVLDALEFVRQERRREIEEFELKKEKWYNFSWFKCKGCTDPCAGGSGSGKKRSGFRKVQPQSSK